MTPAERPDSQEQHLHEVLEGYLKALEAGQAPDRQELLARHPELAQELAAFFADHDQLHRLAAPLRAGGEETLPEQNASSDLASALTTAEGHDPGTQAYAPGQTEVTDAGAQRPSVGSRVRYVGDYELLEELGRGGMGVVYRARQQSLKRTVALKMILAGGHAGPQELARFRTEAEAVARLQHPNIVQIYEVGEHEGHPYATLEYVEGGSLDRKLNGTPLPAREAAQLVETLARAIQAAHRQGVVHRDLKPANVLLSAEGTPKITDFGLAKKLEGEPGVSSPGGLTASGAIMGTPSYMAPEQAAGKTREVGPAADVYALGAILYECLTGRPPFRAETPLDTILQVVSDDPVPPSRLQPKTPRDLETICLKCLEKDARRRYATADALAEDLRNFLEGRPIRARPAGRMEQVIKWARRRPTAAALLTVSVLAVLTLAGITVWFMARLRAERDEARHERAVAQAQALQAETARYAIQIGLAQREIEEHHFVHAEEVLRACRPYLRHWEHHYLWTLLQMKMRIFRGHGAAVQAVAFSPDGQRLASAGWDRTVKVWEAATGREVLSVSDSSPLNAGLFLNAVAFSPDGRRLAWASGEPWNSPGEVKICYAETGQEVLTLKGHSGKVTSIAFSPDGGCLASAGYDSTVKLWDARTGKEVRSLNGHRGWVTGVVFSPDGKRLASASQDGTARVWDAQTGQAVLVLQGHSGGLSAVAFSSDGKQLATGSATIIKLWDTATGRETRTLKGHTDLVTGVAFSPDGRRVASASRDRTLKVWEAADGREVLTLEGHQGPVTSVAFSRDGKRVASASADRTVRTWDITGATEALSLRVRGDCVAFSPDGSRVASTMGKVWDLTVGREVLSFPSSGSVAFSPDGTRLASAWTGSVRLLDAATGREIASFGGLGERVTSVVFCPRDTRLAGASWNNSTIKVWDTATGQEVLTISGPPMGGVWAIAFSPDGRRLASNQGDDVQVWDATSGQAVLTLRGHAHRGEMSVAFSPDGRLLASVGKDRTVRIWEVATGQEVLTLRGHTGEVYSVAFSPDGQRVVSGGEDSTLKLWDVATGQETFSLRTGFDKGVSSVSFSPNGMRLAAGSKVWDGTDQP